MDAMLLHIEGVPGTSLMQGYEGQIEILSYSPGSMQGAADVSDTERTRGKARMQDHHLSKYIDRSTRPRAQDFHLSKYVDGSSPLLNQKCAEAVNLGEVRLTVGRRDGDTVIPLIVYTLSDAVISSVNTAGGGGDRPVESLSLIYSAIRCDYTAQTKAGGAVAGSWDAPAGDQA